LREHSETGIPIIFSNVRRGGVRLNPLGTRPIYQPRVVSECAAIDEMRIDKKAGVRRENLPRATYKGMVRSDMSKPALILFSLQEYT
jgi:hypothetical protein